MNKAISVKSVENSLKISRKLKSAKIWKLNIWKNNF